ncbi:MAG TPA: hemolysin III family protein [Gaiellaceae bacterium]
MTEKVKPRLRGVFHQWAFFLAIPLGVALVLAADTTRARVAAGVFALSVVTMFGASALYHIPDWSPGRRAWLRRLDHAGIYCLIAGSYTPVGLLVLHGAWQTVVLAIVWSGCATAIFIRLFWVTAPKWLSAVVAILLGWVGVVALPKIVTGAGWTCMFLILGGGILYSVGAVVYATRRPDPNPAVFGYHEVFHLLTVLAVGLQYAAIAFYVVPT